jgi:hypothetical protein
MGKLALVTKKHTGLRKRFRLSIQSPKLPALIMQLSLLTRLDRSSRGEKASSAMRVKLRVLSLSRSACTQKIESLPMFSQMAMQLYFLHRCGSIKLNPNVDLVRAVPKLRSQEQASPTQISSQCALLSLVRQQRSPVTSMKVTVHSFARRPSSLNPAKRSNYHAIALFQ